MPLRPCSIPHCSALIQRPARYCAAHEQQGRAATAERNRRYDATRSPAAVAFYNSARWQHARAEVLTNEPTCRRCGKFATTVHHVIPFEQCTPEQQIDPANLVPLCGPECHNAQEAEDAARRGE